MISLRILVFLGFLPTLTPAQDFSGEMRYELKIIAKDPKLNADSMKLVNHGDSTIYLLTNGHYKMTNFRDGEPVYSYTYHPNTQRMYDEQKDKPYITFRDARKSKTGRQIKSVVYKDSVRIVAGYKCFMVERVNEGYIEKTWYAFDLKIDPESFAGHAVGNWYDQIKEVGGCVSLRYVNEYPDRIEIGEVVKVKPRSLGTDEFALPDKLIVASQQALDRPAERGAQSRKTVTCYEHKLSMAKVFKEHTAYVIFVLEADGKISHVQAYEKDEYDNYKVAEAIAKECGFVLRPGEINGKPVASLAVLPVKFIR